MLYYKKYDDDYKNEMINVCINEYENALKSGFSKDEAYFYAIKDFDNEYYKEIADYKKHNINIKSICLSLIISMFFVFTFSVCNQVLSEDVFIWSIWVFVIPNILLLCVKCIINVLIKKTRIQCELLSMLISLMLYLPFILIEFAGNKYDLTNYIITFSFCLLFGIIFYSVKKRQINFILSLIMFLLLTILFSYYIIYTKLFIIEYILKSLIMTSFIVICINSLLKEKFDYKKIIFSAIFIFFISIIFYCLGDPIQIYSKYTFLSVLLIIVLSIQKLLDNKQIKEYSYIIYIFVILVCITTMLRYIYSLYKRIIIYYELSISSF